MLHVTVASLPQLLEKRTRFGNRAHAFLSFNHRTILGTEAPRWRSDAPRCRQFTLSDPREHDQAKSLSSPAPMKLLKGLYLMALMVLPQKLVKSHRYPTIDQRAPDSLFSTGSSVRRPGGSPRAVAGARHLAHQQKRIGPVSHGRGGTEKKAVRAPIRPRRDEGACLSPPCFLDGGVAVLGLTISWPEVRCQGPPSEKGFIDSCSHRAFAFHRPALTWRMGKSAFAAVIRRDRDMRPVVGRSWKGRALCERWSPRSRKRPP